jgi:4-hydroxy-tetrahydrodipicolinate synthase
MQERRPAVEGIWLPLVTPFSDGALDERSLQRLVRHYAVQPIDGLVLAATTGEGLTLDDDETERLVAVAAEAVRDALPAYLGLSGSDTRKLAKALHRTAAWPVEGYLVACPYYTRPSQEGLLRHFSALANETDRPILIYNIPYRTGVNLSNEMLLRLAEWENIVGVKDCCADPLQSFDLLRRRPAGFSVLTGEDAQFFIATSQGAEGGILASAHAETQSFARVRDRLLAGQREAALAEWSRLVELVRLFFAEPSPAPIKHWLWRAGLIDSPELRLPMTQVTGALAAAIEHEMARAGGLAAA